MSETVPEFVPSENVGNCSAVVWENRQREGVDGCGVVSQFNVQGRSIGSRYGHRIVDESCGNGNRIVELCIRGNGVEQKEICAMQHARLVRVFGTTDFFQRRDSYQDRKRLPIAFCPIGVYGTEAQRTKSRGTERF